MPAADVPDCDVCAGVEQVRAAAGSVGGLRVPELPVLEQRYLLHDATVHQQCGGMRRAARGGATGVRGECAGKHGAETVLRGHCDQALPSQYPVQAVHVQPGGNGLVRRGGLGRELSVERHLQTGRVRRQPGLSAGGQVGVRDCAAVRRRQRVHDGHVLEQ